MLGKTNISTVEKGVIVSDIEDYSWLSANIQSVNETFIKVIYANNVLVAITENGTVACTKDGENWECKKLELENGDFFELTDIVYGNGKYVIVGYHTDQETYIHGLIVTTADLIEYQIKTSAETEEYFNSSSLYTKFVSVSVVDNSFVICYIGCKKISSTSKMEVSIYAAFTDMKDTTTINQIDSGIEVENSRINFKNITENTTFQIAKKTNGDFIYYRKTCYNNKYFHSLYVSNKGTGFRNLIPVDLSEAVMGHTNLSADLFSVFECKDNLYYASNTSYLDYEVAKIIGGTEKVAISTNIIYEFVNATYFDKCEVFINSHEMLVVKRGESLENKTLQDMVEITYDFSMKYIVKAFNKMYIFGTGGNILVSSNENRNEDSLAVQTMSAMRALYDAKIYTNEKYEELDTRLTELERQLTNT